MLNVIGETIGGCTVEKYMQWYERAQRPASVVPGEARMSVVLESNEPFVGDSSAGRPCGHLPTVV